MSISNASKKIMRKLDFVTTATQSLNAMPVSQQIDKPTTEEVSPMQTQQHVDKTPKVKATFYLDKQTNTMLTDLYIKHLKEDNKVDRSELICNAIAALYEKKFQ